MTRTVMTVLLFPALALCSCSSSLGGGSSASAFAHASEGGARGTETEQLWIPDDVKHDPAARASLMEQLRVQILQKTRDVPESNRLVVREQLRRQLDRAGFDMQEASYILASLDDPRGPLPEPQQQDVAKPGSPSRSAGLGWKQRGSGGGESAAKPTIDSP